MPFRYIFKQLLMPPGVLLLLLLLGWCLRKRFPRLALVCLLLGFSGLWLSSLPVVVQQGARWLESEPALDPKQWPSLAERADVIVVLGGGREQDDPAWGGDQPSSMALQRVRYAARLAKASGLPLLSSGGLHHGQPPSEAALMAAVLAEDYGLAVRWQESVSRTTWENALYSAPVLQQAGIRRVVLVTQAWHMPRARWCFEQLGLEVVAAPVGFLSVPQYRPAGGWLPESKTLWQSGLLVNEALGLLFYPLAYGQL